MFRHSRVFAHQTASGWKAVAHLPRGRCSFLVRAGGDESGVHVDDQPARERLAHGRGAHRDSQRREHRPPVQQRRGALPAQGGGQPGGKAKLVAGLAGQDRAGVADDAFSVCGDLQGNDPTR